MRVAGGGSGEYDKSKAEVFLKNDRGSLGSITFAGVPL